jgi:hypothetical protein
VAEARPFQDLDAGEAVELGELLAFISDWLAINHQLSLDAHIAGDIAFGGVLVAPALLGKDKGVAILRWASMSSPRLRGTHGSEVISLGQGGFESFSIVRRRSVVLRPGDAGLHQCLGGLEADFLLRLSPPLPDC